MPEGGKKRLARRKLSFGIFRTLCRPASGRSHEADILRREPAGRGARCGLAHEGFEPGHLSGSRLRRLRVRLIGKLHRVEAGIGAALGQQLGMAAGFQDLSVLHDVDPVGGYDR